MPPELPEAGAPQTVLFALVRRRLLQVPFEPFRVVTTSGQSYDVPTADHASVHVLLRKVEIVYDDCSIIDIHALHIAAIETLPKKRKRRAA